VTPQLTQELPSSERTFRQEDLLQNFRRGPWRLLAQTRGRVAQALVSWTPSTGLVHLVDFTASSCYFPHVLGNVRTCSITNSACSPRYLVSGVCLSAKC
jgi:hypothetical protein